MKKTLALILSLSMIATLAACGAPENTAPADDTSVETVFEAAEETTAAEETETEAYSEAETEAETAAEEIAAQSVYPLTVTDQAGRTVTIESKPEKLVSGYYISTSTLIALGLEDKMVGIEAKADKRAIYKLSAPELIDLPNVGSAKEFDLEGCIALEPDLVILPIKLKSVVEDLESFGISVLLVNPETTEQLDEMITLIAQATDTSDRAAQINAFADAQREHLAPLSENAPAVYLAGNSSLLSTAGQAMYQSDMIKTAGGKNVADEITDTYWAEIDYEQLLTWDPEYIILASDAEYTVEDVLADENIAGVKAVAEQKVYQLPSKAEAWDSPVPSGILGSVWTASVIHGDEVSAEECSAVIDEFYNTFYGFSYSEQE